MGAERLLGYSNSMQMWNAAKNEQIRRWANEESAEAQRQLTHYESKDEDRK